MIDEWLNDSQLQVKREQWIVLHVDLLLLTQFVGILYDSDFDFKIYYSHDFCALL